VATITDEVAGWVISIAGLMKRGTDSVTPLGISTGDFREPSDTLFGDAYAQILRLEDMGEISHAVSPLRGDPRGAGPTFTLQLDDENYPEISEFLLGPGASVDPLTHLADDEAIGAKGVSFDVTAADGGLISPDDVVYIGREAFRVDSVSTDTITIVDEIPDTVGGINARSSVGALGAEGHGGTFIAAHDGLSSSEPTLPFPDSRIWDATPFVRGREVMLYKATGEGLETVHGRFIISAEPEVDRSGTRVRIRCRDILGMLADRQLNSRPIRYRATAVASVSPASDSEGEFVTIVGTMPLVNLDASVNVDQANARRLWPDDDIGVYSVDRTVVIGAARGGADAMSLPGRTVEVADGGGWLRSTREGDVSKFTGEDAHEILVTMPLDGTYSPHSMTDQTTHPLYSTDLGAVVSHPYELILAIIGGIASNLPDHWKAPLPATWIDTTGIRDATAWTEWARPWPGEALGAGGKSYPALKMMSERLRALGASFGYTTDFKLTVRSIYDVPNPTALGDSRIRAGRAIAPDSSLTVDTIRVRTGQGVGRDKEDAHLLVLDDGYDTELFPYSSDVLEIEAPGLIHPDEDVSEDAVTADSRIVGLQGSMRSVASLFRHPPHVRTGMEVTGVTRIMPGEFYTFSEWGGRDQDTGLIGDDTADSYLGLVLSVRENLSAQGNQVLTVAKLPFDAVCIGPACQVAAYDDSTKTLTVTQVLYLKNLGADSDYQVAGSSFVDDADQFALGGHSKAHIIDANLVAKTEAFTISSVTSTTIIATTSIELLGGGTYSKAAGDRVVAPDWGKGAAVDQATLAFLGRSKFTA